MKILLVSADEKTTISYRLDAAAGSYGLGLLKRRHDGDILDGFSMGNMADQGYRLFTDAPGRVLGALGLPREARGIVYSPHPEQVNLMNLVKQYGLTNQQLADRTASTLSTAERWTGDPWSRRHSPIPRAKYLLLEASIKTNPPNDASGLGRPRRTV